MEHQLWIDGRWTESQGGGAMDVENPATGEVIAQVVDASWLDVDEAVQSAKDAFYDGRWSKLTPGDRSLALWRPRPASLMVSSTWSAGATTLARRWSNIPTFVWSA